MFMEPLSGAAGLTRTACGAWGCQQRDYLPMLQLCRVNAGNWAQLSELIEMHYLRKVRIKLILMNEFSLGYTYS